jgi:hypothetical protein
VVVRKISLMIILLFSLTAFKTFSQDRGFGLGVIFGEPTGFSGKYWVDEDHAFDFGLAYSFAHPNRTFSLHADYLFHRFDVLKTADRFPIYYGFGGRIHFGNKDGNTLGARGVVGILWMHRSLPIDLFVELAPVFNLFPETSLHLDFAIGGRYYFK